MPTTPVEEMSFLARDATTPRQLQDHVGDVLNVKSFGAMGDDSTNDRVAIQKCFDTAFGGPTSTDPSDTAPHGVTNAWKNRAVFFPPGRYIVNTSPLTLTNVYGGKIFGSGNRATQIQSGDGASVGVFVCDGIKDCVFQDMGLTAGSSAVCFDLDWQNSVAAGLGGNLFIKLNIGTALVGTGVAMRIAHTATTQGHCNQFTAVEFSGSTAVLIEGATAYSQLFQGGGISGGAISLKATGGSFHVNGSSMDARSTTACIHLDTDIPCSIESSRTEQDTAIWLRMIKGRMLCSGVYSASDPLPTIAELGATARLTLDSCFFYGVFTATASGPKLYLRNCLFDNAAYKTGYLASGGTIPEEYT